MGRPWSTGASKEPKAEQFRKYKKRFKNSGGTIVSLRIPGKLLDEIDLANFLNRKSRHSFLLKLLRIGLDMREAYMLRELEKEWMKKITSV